MIETVNNLDSPGFKKLSKLQKLILSELFASENHSKNYSDLGDIIAKKTNNIIKKKTFEERKEKLTKNFKEEYYKLPEDKKPLLSELLKIDLKLLYFNLQNNKWRFKKYFLKDSFRASFSRTITRLENRNLIKTYNYYIPDHALKENFSTNETKDGYKVLYRKFVELTPLGFSLFSKYK